MRGRTTVLGVSQTMTVRRRERRIGAAPGGAGCAGLLVALAAVAGCSGTGAAAEGDPRAAVRQAADVLAEAGTSRARTAMEMASGGTRITLSGRGGFDYAAGTGELRVSLPEGRRVTEVFVPGRLFMKNRGAGVPADKWVRVDVTGLPDGNLVTGGATDPIAAAELLRGARSVTDLGDIRMDGETLRHYRGVTDIAAAASAAAGESRKQLAAAVGGFARTEVPFDVYLDDQGRLRKVRHDFTFADGAGRGVDVTSTVVLYDFGVPVEVVLPGAGDVFAGAVG
ncbi:hypothetical protein RM779_05745 [Streptomyces sp. DSM 41886]|uniref:Lipoprotein n=1 Tax=Streptomyces johnsoniae TaxID=3075532 RepID=A0ABU2RZA7_9ACTN|nr:hypothetical protein [Streptomyces sp. DSM 41886]